MLRISGGAIAIVILAVVVVANSVHLNGAFSQQDLKRFEQYLTQSPIDSAEIGFYVARGLKAMNIEPSKDFCDAFKRASSSADLSELYFAKLGSAFVKGCSVDVNAKTLIEKTFESSKSAQDLFYATALAKGYKVTIPKTLSTKLSDALKTDDSVEMLSYSFLAAESIADSVEKQKFFSRIEDAVNQADEVDNIYMQFEGGIMRTSLVISSAYRLASNVGKEPPISDDQIIKFANYFHSRRLIKNARSIGALLDAATMLSGNKWRQPFHISFVSASSSVNEQFPDVVLRTVDLMGRDISTVKLMVESAKGMVDGAVIMNNQMMTVEKNLHKVNVMSIGPPAGLYILKVVSKETPKNLIKVSELAFNVRIMATVSVKNAKIAVLDGDEAASSSKLKGMTRPEKIDLGRFDKHQKIVFELDIADQRTNGLFTPHQVFVQFESTKSKTQEIFYVAEADEITKRYRFELDGATMERDFAGNAGDYIMRLIVGDAVVTNPISWHFANVNVKVSSASAKKASPFIQSFDKLPEIKHMYAKQDKRPPKTISLLFTALCCLPFVIMLGIWLSLGVNISGIFNSSFLISVAFHGSYGVIFFLYFLYWIRFNMFDTLKYLALIAIPCFFLGHRTLVSINQRRQQQNEKPS